MRLNADLVNRVKVLALPEIACHSGCVNREQFGASITQRRLGIGMSRDDLAAKLHISLRTLGSWERGDNGAALKNRSRIERILGPLQISDETPSVASALAALRDAAAQLDLAREILYAVQAASE